MLFCLRSLVYMHLFLAWRSLIRNISIIAYPGLWHSNSSNSGSGDSLFAPLGFLVLYRL